MKQRIIDALKDISANGNSFMGKLLCDELKLYSTLLSYRAKNLLSQILHNYSDFSIGTIDSFTHKIVKTFAFDRFVDIQVTDRTFEGKVFDSEKYFKNVYGITEGAGKAETVLLSFTPAQGKYIQSQPLHHSQKVIRETKSECRISLDIMVNHELVSQLLSYGSQVKVIKPLSLVQKIKDELKNSAVQYQ